MLSSGFIEAAGAAYGPKMVGDALGLGATGPATGPEPRFETRLSRGEKARAGAAALRGIGLLRDHARW